MAAAVFSIADLVRGEIHSTDSLVSQGSSHPVLSVSLSLDKANRWSPCAVFALGLKG